MKGQKWFSLGTPALGTQLTLVQSCIVMLWGRGPSPEGVCFGLAGSVYVLHFIQERFHHTSLGDFECIFPKAGASETRKGLG